MKRQDLVIVESPFQLLCGIEAQHHFSSEKPILIVKYTREKKNNDQIDKLLATSTWHSIIKFRTYFFISFSELFIIPYMAWMKWTRRKFRNIFLGESRNAVLQAFVANLQHENTFLLDDGNATYFVQSELKAGKSLHELVIQGKYNRIFTNLYYRILGVKSKVFSVPFWFTCFDIEPIEGQKIYINNFASLRSKYLDKKDSDESRFYFIGGNLSEAGVLPLSEELRLLELIFVSSLREGKKILYCVHRRESEEKLKLILKIDDNISLRQAQYPLELDLVFEGTPIHKVASFYSSALITIKKIFNPADCKMYIIPQQFIAAPYKNEINSIYSNYASQIESIKLI